MLVICHKPTYAFVSLFKIELAEILNQRDPDIKRHLTNAVELKDHRRGSCHKNSIIVSYGINRDTLESDFDLVFPANFKYVFSGNAVKYGVVRSSYKNVSFQKKDVRPASFSNAIFFIHKESFISSFKYKLMIDR